MRRRTIAARGTPTRRAGRPAATRAALLLAVLGVLAFASCERGPDPARRPGPLRVVVSVAPLTGLVRAIVPDDATVRTLVPPGRSLHGHELTPADLAAIADADVLVYVGLGLEPALEHALATHPSARRREVCFAKVVGVESSASHAHDGGHGHAVDPHLWLDPELVARLVPEAAAAVDAAIRDAGFASTPVGVRLLDARHRLLAEIEAVDAEYRERLAPFAGSAIVTHHDAFGRLADRYRLRIAAVIRPIETADPSPAHLAAAADAIRREGVRAVFFEPGYDPAAARTIADAAGVPAGTLDPEGSTDWFALMRANLNELTRRLAQP